MRGCVGSLCALMVTLMFVTVTLAQVSVPSPGAVTSDKVEQAREAEEQAAEQAKEQRERAEDQAKEQDDSAEEKAKAQKKRAEKRAKKEKKHAKKKREKAKKKGLDRADEVAGEHGKQGRDRARSRQRN